MWCFCMFVHSGSYHRDILWWCSALLDKGDEFESNKSWQMNSKSDLQRFGPDHSQPLMVTPCRCLKDHQGFMEWAFRSSCFKGGKHWRGRDGLGGGFSWKFSKVCWHQGEQVCVDTSFATCVYTGCHGLVLGMGGNWFRRQSFKVSQKCFWMFLPVLGHFVSYGTCSR